MGAFVIYIVDGICYADEKTESINISEDKVLRGVGFSTGEKRLFDTTELTGSAFTPLKDEKVLSDFTIFHGVLTWQNGEIDIAPEKVYDMSYPYNSAELVG